MEVRMTLSDHISGRRSLRSVLDSDKHSDSTSGGASRTLMDIIRDDHAISHHADLPLSTRTTAAFSDDLLIGLPTSPVFGPRLQTAISRGETVVTPTEAAAAEEQQQQQPVRVSLMALLGQAEEEDEEVQNEDVEEDEVVAEVEEGGTYYHVCCVCMLRHKGAAFIPCGHTFCRLCSRKLWVNRRNCPLCNGYILEILDIF